MTEKQTAGAASRKTWRTELSPLSFLLRSEKVWADREAVRDGHRVWTYAEHAERVRRAVTAIRGVLRTGTEAHGTRVATLLPNVSAMLELHYAVPAAGGVLVPMNTRLAPREYAYILQHSQSSLVVASRALQEEMQHALDLLPSPRPQVVWHDGSDGGMSEYEELLAAAAPGDVEVPTNENSLLSINYTSGTTGRPKGVMTSHRGAYLHSLGVIAEARLDARSGYLWTLPMFHCNGWAYTWAVTAAGSTHICLPNVDGPQIWAILQKRAISHLCAAPTVLSIILTASEAQRLSSPVRVFVGGAPPAPALIERAERLNFAITHLYGLTETYGPIAVCAWNPDWDDVDPEQRAQLRARQGVATIVSENMRVVDAEMRDVPADGRSIGEVVMRGNNVMLGYYRDPDATVAAFHGGWFHSGDLGVMHPDGYVELRDRAKDVIISGGENISSIEVEQALNAHPRVSEAAVVGAPDTFWGEVPVAFVVAAQPPPSAEELMEFVRQRIARFKVPKRVEFVSALPKTSTGKIQKFMLRDELRTDRP